MSVRLGHDGAAVLVDELLAARALIGTHKRANFVARADEDGVAFLGADRGADLRDDQGLNQSEPAFRAPRG